MDHELCKKLKDAGFPQEIYYEILYSNGTRFRNTGKKLSDKKSCIVPSLSELIEACGDEFGQLEHWKYEPHWRAISYGGRHEGTGTTPEEAVANLWLKIHEK